MDNYVIISDSTCDLTQKMVDEIDVEVLPLTFSICGKEYKNYLDEREFQLDDFYSLMNKGEMAKTAQINVVDAIEFLKPILDNGNDVLFIAFSSGLSGSCNAIRLASEQLLDEYKERKIKIVDSLCASSGEGLLIYEAYENKKAGMSLEENFEAIEKLKFNVRHWFTVSQLETLRRGGRLSNAAAFAAKLLNIKPVLHVDDEGHLKAVYKKMGRKLAIKQLIESSINGYDMSKEHLTLISHADCIDDANKLKEMLEIEYNKNNIKSKIIICKIGPVIGAHAGPGTLALFTIGDKR